MADQIQHQPVMLKATLEYLKPQAGQVYLDLTAGFGGHAAAVLQRTVNPKGAVLVDRDEAATKSLQAKFPQARVIQQDYASACEDLLAQGFKADILLMDLGVSSWQLDKAQRGFSFNKLGPLDMRMDQRQATTADDLVNKLKADKLADVLYRYGEERNSRRIARAIINARPISSTDQLANVIAQANRGRSGGGRRIHPATRSFQALRIAVNDELGQLEATLPLLPALMNPGARLVVISFHSLEDRLVKHFIKGCAQLEALTKKPLAGKDYDAINPRARSAKLRAAKRLGD